MASNDVRGVFSGGFGGVLVENQRVSCSSQPLDSFFISGSSSSFLGSSSMVSFEDVYGGKRSERSFFCTYDPDENGDEEFDDYFHQPGKKRRLTVQQVQFLEKSFEVENKLDPERKIQLAKDLGLQPRQVAIWFQNRRARWKTKQLEKDFDTLQASYNNLKVDFDNLFKEKEKLQAEVLLLTDKLHQKEKEKGHHSESSNMHHQVSRKDQIDAIVDSTSESDEHNVPKQEDQSSVKSDVVDSDSPQRVDGSHTSRADYSFAFEADHSDISQDDEDYLSKSLLPSSHVFSKMEDNNFGLTGEDHASMFWPYWDINLKM